MYSLSSAPPQELRDIRRAAAQNSSSPVIFPPEHFIRAQSIFHSGIQPLFAAMNPGSPSRHPSEAKEEDSPLQQSTQGSHPQTADSYPEDIMSKAEEEMAGLTAEEATEKEINGKAEEEEQDDGAEAEEEQIPKNLHGYWVKCHVKDTHVQALENEGTVAPQAESH
jgi:hypothetical protein